MQDMGKMPPGLKRRGNVFEVRRRVPDQIRAEIGKTEITKSLGTGDVKIALELFAAKNAEIEELFANARRKVSKALPEDLTKEQAAHFAKKWFKTELVKARKNAATVFGSQELGEFEQNLREELSFIKCASDPEIQPTLQQVASRILAQHGYSFNASHAGKDYFVGSSEGYWELVSLVRQGWLQINRLTLDYLEGRSSDEFDLEIVTPSSQNSTALKNNIITLHQLVDDYLKSDPARTERAILDFNAAFRPMLEVLGSDKPIRHLRPDDFVKVRDLVLRLPPNASKSGKNKHKSLVQIAKDNIGGTVLSPKTANKYLNRMSALMQWAVDKWELEKNPALGLHVSLKEGESNKDKRHPFDIEQLNRIFASGHYSNPDKNSPSFYWLPLIALFHGMRMEEILQLTISDVQSEDGNSFFRLHDKGENKLKNSNAKRDVPIHPQLYEFGFGSFLKSISLKKNKRLFWDVPRSKNNRTYSSIFSKRFSRHLFAIEAKKPKTSFHSFRHNFRDSGRENQIPQDRVCAIAGWEYEQGTQAIYGSGISLAEKSKAIRNIGYSGLDLSKIKKINWNQ